MAGKSAGKEKSKVPAGGGTAEKASAKKGPAPANGKATAPNGTASSLANGYNPLLGTFHSVDAPAAEPGTTSTGQNGGYQMFDPGASKPSAGGDGDASSSDSEDSDDGGAEERKGAKKGQGAKGDKRHTEKTRLRNERKHQRQKERRAQELRDKCIAYLTARKVETLALQLVAMGFPKDRSVVAVTCNSGDLERCVSWLLEGGAEQQESGTPPDPSLAKIDISDELARLVDAEMRFGLSRGEIERVVISCDGDVDKTMGTLAAQHQLRAPSGSSVGAPQGHSQAGGFAPNLPNGALTSSNGGLVFANNRPGSGPAQQQGIQAVSSNKGPSPQSRLYSYIQQQQEQAALAQLQQAQRMQQQLQQQIQAQQQAGLAPQLMAPVRGSAIAGKGSLSDSFPPQGGWGSQGPHVAGSGLGPSQMNRQVGWPGSAVSGPAGVGLRQGLSQPGQGAGIPGAQQHVSHLRPPWQQQDMLDARRVMASSLTQQQQAALAGQVHSSLGQRPQPLQQQALLLLPQQQQQLRQLEQQRQLQQQQLAAAMAPAPSHQQRGGLYSPSLQGGPGEVANVRAHLASLQHQQQQLLSSAQQQWRQGPVTTQGTASFSPGFGTSPKLTGAQPRGSLASTPLNPAAANFKPSTLSQSLPSNSSGAILPPSLNTTAPQPPHQKAPASQAGFQGHGQPGTSAPTSSSFPATGPQLSGLLVSSRFKGPGLAPASGGLSVGLNGQLQQQEVLSASTRPLTSQLSGGSSAPGANLTAVPGLAAGWGGLPLGMSSIDWSLGGQNGTKSKSTGLVDWSLTGTPPSDWSTAAGQSSLLKADSSSSSFVSAPKLNSIWSNGGLGTGLGSASSSAGPGLGTFKEGSSSNGQLWGSGPLGGLGWGASVGSQSSGPQSRDWSSAFGGEDLFGGAPKDNRAGVDDSLLQFLPKGSEETAEQTDEQTAAALLSNLALQ